MEILKWFTYIMKMSDFKYFKYSEFDSPDKPGSGEKNMSKNFIELLDEAREFAGIPFKINSGFRSKEHNESLRARGFKAVKNSAHLKGLAADIRTKTSAERFKVVDALLYVGMTRIGIGKGFVHCDIDKTKTPELIWHYY
jgi:zinc D-Ala-D-Ala carboxypeptidase